MAAAASAPSSSTPSTSSASHMSATGPAEVGGLAPPPSGQEFCVLNGAGAAATGAFMGGVIGMGSGMWKTSFKNGVGTMLKGGWVEAGNSAKTFALMGGLYSAVVCYMKKFRNAEDALNSGVAGCATGLALSWSGGPSAALQGCAGFGLFSWLMDAINPPPAHALELKQMRHLKPGLRTQRQKKLGFCRRQVDISTVGQHQHNCAGLGDVVEFLRTVCIRALYDDGSSLF
eukprot:jgi/Chlat1/8252/Chrsp77S07676